MNQKSIDKQIQGGDAAEGWKLEVQKTLKIVLSMKHLYSSILSCLWYIYFKKLSFKIETNSPWESSSSTDSLDDV